jgi:hypothetical protein
MNPTENWGPASRARPEKKIAPAAAATIEDDAARALAEAASTVLVPEAVVGLALAETDAVPVKDNEGLDVRELMQAEDVVEIDGSSRTKRKSDPEAAGTDRQGKKVKTQAEIDEEAMMNEV